MIFAGVAGAGLAWLGSAVVPLALAGGLAFVGWTVWQGRGDAQRAGVAECRQAVQEVTIEQLKHEVFRRERAEQLAAEARAAQAREAERLEARLRALTSELDARGARTICYPRDVARKLNEGG